MDQTPDLQQLLRLAQSPVGQQLLNTLKKQDPEQLNTAKQYAAAGNYTQALNSISEVLSSPQIQELLRQLGASNE